MKCKVPSPAQERKLIYPQYLLRCFYRLCVFLSNLVCYVLRPELLRISRPWREIGLFSPAHILLLSMAVSMVCQHFRRPGMSMGRMKQYAKFSDPDPCFDPAGLAAAVKAQNRGALRVALVWLAGNTLVAALFFRHWIGEAELLLLCAFYYLSDMICILFVCPFQLFLMGNRCCVNCRIFAWGSWMMSTPLVLLPCLPALSVAALSLTLLGRWELHYRRHPELFWRGSNCALRCANCAEHLCRAKRVPAPGFRDPKD